MSCELCGSSSEKLHSVREMMFGTREVFRYRECLECGRLRIAEVPSDLGRHYPSNGYPCFIGQNHSLKNRVRQKIVTAGIYHPALARLTESFYKLDTAELGHLLRLRPELKTLDVGCGAGRLVADHRAAGFNIVGIDPFATESEIVRKGELSDVQDSFDRILFNHSLEHIEDQVGTLQLAKERLTTDGMVIVRIPIASWTWKEYETNWVQLDAPRHLSIHTEKSFQLAAEQAGLRVIDTVYDSFAFQFWGSELYRLDVPLEVGRPCLRQHFTPKQMAYFKRRAEVLNAERQGDQAAFFLAPQ